MRRSALALLTFVALGARLIVFHGHDCERLHASTQDDLCLPAGYHYSPGSQPGSHEHESCPVCQSYESQNAFLLVLEGALPRPLSEFQARILLQARPPLLALRPAFAARAPPV
ncbi:MAG: hypothetical protein HS115_16140 [Spirochaetales bacterium]|nr:hypothetical protein [Spirochaetales bacterium]